MTKNHDKTTVVIGGGPAGLTAAYELSKTDIKSIVVEKDEVVGGLARTVDRNGFLFDIGGHRFFTKVKAVEEMWNEVLQDDFLHRDRLSRIYYNNTFFYYPFKVSNAVFGLGVWNSILILTSYFKAQLLPLKPEDTFETWITNRFGTKLYQMFFKTYTEKVWGIPCDQISAEWAAQRIKGLSLMSALKNALISTNNGNNDKVIKTLIDKFHYPKLGPGMMWEKVRDIVESRGHEVLLNSCVDKIVWNGEKLESIEIVSGNEKTTLSGDHFISSMPIRELIAKLDPKPQSSIEEAANSLNYRDFLTVVVILDKPEVFPDNWIYIHDPDVSVGRIQNFKNWSPYMVPDPAKTCLGLEYFCFEGDDLWDSTDTQLIELASKELETLGLVNASDITEGHVVRMPKAYPVYDSTYRQSLATIRDFVNNIDNLQLVGRNGMHRYNNQDHSMLTAMLAVKNILGADYDLWQVNMDSEYLEEQTEAEGTRQQEYADLESTQPRVPVTVNPETVASAEQALIIRAFSRLDQFALGVSVGSVSAIGILLATMILVLKGGPVVGPNMQLLSNYFQGYTVSIQGAFLAAGYCLFLGFIFGWLFAYLKNLFTAIYIFGIKKRSELNRFSDFLDHI